MKKLFNISAKLKSEKGVTAVYVAIMLFVFIGMFALAVDVGYMMAAKNESQNAADAAALAGARRLGENYYVSTSPVTTDVTTVAQNTASQNKVAGQNPAVDNIDIKVGTWTPPFAETSIFPNAVWAEVKREEGLASGAIDTFFARVLGINNYKIAATACAAISGPCTSGESIPLGIGRSWFENVGANRGCTQIALNSTGSSCAGWTTLSTTETKYSDMKDILTGAKPNPTVTVGQWINFKGGVNTPVLNALIDLFNDTTRYASNKTFNNDGSVATWKTSVVVYEDHLSCDNPNSPMQVLGFATIKITGFITNGSDKGPVGIIQCHIAEESRGGCYYAGTYGAIPGLVK